MAESRAGGRRGGYTDRAGYHANGSDYSFLSSPKRYLWNHSKSEAQWSYFSENGDTQHVQLPNHSESGLLRNRARSNCLTTLTSSHMCPSISRSPP